MNKQSVYERMEKKIPNYTDYANVPVRSTGEPMVAIPATDTLWARQLRDDIRPYTGDQIYVRKQVLEKLGQAAAILNNFDDSLGLEVGYGYRALEVQKQRFKEVKAKYSSQYSGDELLSWAHKFVAVPEVAGHPAGAAVDLQIVRDGTPLDFGTRLWAFEPDSFTFSPFVGNEAQANRRLLRSAMAEVGFAPFDGEWWHFSYGDKEWAKYYNAPAALYEQIDFRTVAPE